MGKASRVKGAGGEREFAKILEEHTGIRLERVLEQWRSGGYDLDKKNGDFPFAVEVKRRRIVRPGDITIWWFQTELQAVAADKVPVLAYRGDRRPWRVVVPLDALAKNLCSASGIDWTAELSVSAFCMLIREIGGITNA